MDDEVPLQWLLFQQAVTDVVNRGCKYMSLDEVRKLPGAVGTSETELTTLLQFYHDMGHIIYIGDGCSQDLRNLVILDPKWLIDVFKAVINVVDWEDRRAVDIDAWTRLEEEGIMEERLIKRMWKDLVGNHGPETDSMKCALLDLMERFDLLCLKVSTKETCGRDDSNRLFYVPCRLQPSTKPLTPSSTPQGCHPPDATVFYVDFKDFLPDGIFHRLLARSVRWSQDQGGLEPELHYRHATFYADELHEFELEMTPHREARLKVTISRSKVAGLPRCKLLSSKKASPEACMKVKQFLLDTLMDLKTTWARGLQYKLCILCPCCMDQYLDLEECIKEDIVPCRTHRVSTRDVQVQLGGRVFPAGDNKLATHTVLSDQFLMLLADKMDDKWEFIATSQLGFTREDLIHIKHANDTMVTQTWAMLIGWRQRQPGRDATGVVEDLCKAFVDSGRRDLAEMCSAILD